jgi:hypothetical protein
MGDDLGTIEAGKIADLLVLDRNPFEAARNFDTISAIFKDGVQVELESLPTEQLLTAPLEAPVPEEADYIAFGDSSRRVAAPAFPNFPCCPTCRWH